jgi:rhamnosyltransferase
MKAAVVIPTLNAASNGRWEQVLNAVNRQSCPGLRKIVLDSSSDDETCATARLHNWETLRLNRKNFNHGKTRDRIAKILHKRGFDTVVFLTQDCIPASPDSISTLINFLWSNDISGCYGRQLSNKKCSLNQWQRNCFYPETSCIKTAADLIRKDSRAVFFSNAFSAWKTEDIQKAGGFPETDFGEDTLLALHILQQGGKTGYCADATVLHDHSDNLMDLFHRGMQIGKFHRKHPEIRQQALQNWLKLCKLTNLFQQKL